MVFRKKKVPWNKDMKIDKEKFPDWGMTGKKSWCKGLTKETDERVKMRSERIEKKIKNKNYKQLTPEKSYILGVLCGDGYIAKNLISLGVIDKDFAEYFAYCLEKVYGLKTKIYFIKIKSQKFPKGHTSLCKPQYNSVLHSRQSLKDILRYNKKGFKTKTWRVPREIMESKNEKIIGMFLKGFFDSEGCVNVRWVDGYSSNYQALKDIQKLLEKINIKSNFRKLNRDYEMYQLSIYSKPNQAIFLNKVGFSIKRKMDKLINILKNSSKYKYSSEQYNNVLRLHKNGLGKVKISRILNINSGTVSGWIYGKKRVIPLSVRNGDLIIN